MYVYPFIVVLVLWILIYALGGGGSIGDFFGTLLVAELVTLLLLLFYWANGDPREAIEAQRVLLGYDKLFFSNDMGFVATGNASELSEAVDALCIRKISRYTASKNKITVYGTFSSVRNTERGIRNADEMKAASLDVDSTQSSRYKKLKRMAEEGRKKFVIWHIYEDKDEAQLLDLLDKLSR